MQDSPYKMALANTLAFAALLCLLVAVTIAAGFPPPWPWWFVPVLTLHYGLGCWWGVETFAYRHPFKR